MTARTALMAKQKKIALIAHDNRKEDLLAWARYNQRTLERHLLDRHDRADYGGGTGADH